MSKVTLVTQSPFCIVAGTMVAVLSASLFCSRCFAGRSKLSRCITRPPEGARRLQVGTEGVWLLQAANDDSAPGGQMRLQNPED